VWQLNKQGIPALYLLVKREVLKKLHWTVGSKLFGAEKGHIYTAAKTVETDTCVVGARKLGTRYQAVLKVAPYLS
jgi:hypothetical protein